MSDKKTKIGCELITRGTDKANAQAIDDLSVPDPEPEVGKKIINDAVKEEEEQKDGSGSKNS